jgi:hypothetical protein
VGENTHHNVQQLCDMPIPQLLENLDFTLQVLEELCAEAIALYSLDGHIASCLLNIGQG